jgi:site-specific DNA-cytosine methylase
MFVLHSQGHSRTNRFQDPDDPRNEELFKMMSEIDRASPDYVVLENVAGFKDARDDGTFIDPKSTTSWAHLAIKLLLQLG